MEKDVTSSEPVKENKKAKSTASLDIGSSMVSEKDGMTMVYVPAGEFPMGSKDDDPDARDNEKPLHTVYLDAYWIDKTPVTNAMFAIFLNEMGNQEEEGGNWLNTEKEYVKISESNGVWNAKKGFEDYPVVGITWYAARAYSQWAGRRLPTEAEWEKAARGTDGRTFPWGEGINTELANYKDTVVFPETSPVDNYPEGASPYGALDMAGNVWECTQDWYDGAYYKNSPKENPQGPSSGEQDPQGPDSGVHRVTRGGAYCENDKKARAGYRDSGPPIDSWYDLGFRCVCSA